MSPSLRNSIAAAIVDDIGRGARIREGSQLLPGGASTGVVDGGGGADVYYVGAHRVVIGRDFTTCECPANREMCPHVERVLEHRRGLVGARA